MTATRSDTRTGIPSFSLTAHGSSELPSSPQADLESVYLRINFDPSSHQLFTATVTEIVSRTIVAGRASLAKRNSNDLIILHPPTAVYVANVVSGISADGRGL